MKTLQLAFSRKNTNFQAKHIPHTCQDTVMLSLPPSCTKTNKSSASTKKI
jgi:hypothetical protein